MTEHFEQQMPIPNDHPSIQSQVRADLDHREKVGISRYGTALQPHNGRDALRDLYEELLDGACYVKQKMVEEAHATAVLIGLLTELQHLCDQLETEANHTDGGLTDGLHDAAQRVRNVLKAADQRTSPYTAEVIALRARVEQQHEVNRGWVEYGGRVKAEQRRWREQLAAALGIEDVRGIVPQMPELIEAVRAAHSTGVEP